MRQVKKHHLVLCLLVILAVSVWLIQRKNHHITKTFLENIWHDKGTHESNIKINLSLRTANLSVIETRFKKNPDGQYLMIMSGTKPGNAKAEITFKTYNLSKSVGSVEPMSNKHNHTESSPASSVQIHQWQKDLGLYSTNPFVFMFGTTAVQVGGSVPSKCSLLFIGVHSGPKMADQRQAMRDTYLKGISSDIVYRFILGHPNHSLAVENSKHKDIVFINQTDRYTAMDSVLPYKAAAMFVMASRMSMSPSWMLKTDDDSLVNLPAVLKKLQTFKENEYYGSCQEGWYPNRQLSSKWYVSNHLWPDKKRYPPFCAGTGYFLSRKAYNCAARVIQTSSYKYFPLEDVGGGILMSQCNITAVNVRGIYRGKPSLSKRNFLIQHYVSTPELVHELWQNISALSHR